MLPWRSTTDEIIGQWEFDADLVGLSGCETGLGRRVVGEGYIGLAHACLQAGARSLVVSIWRVEDYASSMLMTRFYESLDRMSKVEALAEAKRHLRAYRDAGGGHPSAHPFC